MKTPIKGASIPLSLTSISGIQKGVAEKLKRLRLQKGWSRATLAARSGVSLWTVKYFETTGKVSFGKLVKFAFALDAISGFEQLFPSRAPQAATLDELERLQPTPRKRGRTIT